MNAPELPDVVQEQAEAWHAMPPEQAFEALDSSELGLNAGEALRRREHYGANALTPPKRRGPLLRLVMQFHSVLLYVMMGAGAVSAVLGHWVDTGVLLAAVVINAVIGFIQEGRAEAALDSIRAMLSPSATVLRHGEVEQIDAVALVPGDIVLLVSGDRVPADLRLIAARELRLEEAALTGESVPTDKNAATLSPDIGLSDRVNMAYSGTVVVYGQATGLVVATGDSTELGKINRMLGSVRQATTPLLEQMDRFGRALAVVILAIGLLTFLVGTLWRGHAMADMFMAVVALVAAAIPEGLPAIMTVTLAIGVQRMARRRAIIRRLPAVEALGAVTVICSDKTGTLTRNEMTVQRIACRCGRFDVSGSGYAPHGKLSADGHDIDVSAHSDLCTAIRAGLLCNDARLRQTEDGQWQIEGDPTEGALLVLGAKAGLSPADSAQKWPRRGSIPFESQHRFMASFHHSPEGQPWIFVKGAPEAVMAMCRTEYDRGDDHPLCESDWLAAAHDMATQGLRVLALACAQRAPAGASLELSDLEQGLSLLALVGIVDPPRDEVKEAVRLCHGAGIRVKMITGDHVETARAIGAQLNIGVDREAITGSTLSTMDDQTLREVVKSADVFARASPEHKLRLVQALQDGGEVVAMTGDGVNDAPALKRADIGVAMGGKGTEAAKEAADMVLADDNFATISRAVREGRAIYDILRKFIMFSLPTNGGEALIVIAGILLGVTLPLTPAQVLWVNTVTATTLGVALAFEPAERGLMKRRPRPPQSSMLSGFFVWRIAMVSCLMAVAAFSLHEWALQRSASIEVARTIAVNTVVACEMFYLFNSRSILGPVTNRAGLLGNYYVLWAEAACILLQLAFTYLPVMQELFGTASLTLTEWTYVIGAGAAVFVIIELEKWIVRHTKLAARVEM